MKITLLLLAMTLSMSARAGEREVAALDAEFKKALSPAELEAGKACIFAKQIDVRSWPDGSGSLIAEFAKTAIEDCREMASQAIPNHEARKLISADKSIAIEYLSWRRCEVQQQLTEANAAITEERQRGRISGVVSKEVLYESGGQIMDSTKHIKMLDGEFKKLRAKPLACNSAKLEPVADCIPKESPDSMRCRAMQLLHLDYQGPGE